MTMQRCEHCGATRIEFDPPIEIRAGEACRAVKPGTYGVTPGGIPVCQLPRHGKDEPHLYVVEYVLRWSDLAEWKWIGHD